MSPEQRAAEAQHVLENPLFKAAFDEMRAGIINQIHIVAVNDVETQHELVLMLQLLESIKGRIEQHIHTGSFEKQQLGIVDSWREKIARLKQK